MIGYLFDVLVEKTVKNWPGNPFLKSVSILLQRGIVKKSAASVLKKSVGGSFFGGLVLCRSVLLFPQSINQLGVVSVVILFEPISLRCRGPPLLRMDVISEKILVHEVDINSTFILTASFFSCYNAMISYAYYIIARMRVLIQKRWYHKLTCNVACKRKPGVVDIEAEAEEFYTLAQPCGGAKTAWRFAMSPGTCKAFFTSFPREPAAICGFGLCNRKGDGEDAC